MPKPLKTAKVYDKRRPAGEQDVAYLSACVEDGAPPLILFGCQQFEGGVMYLEKQHAIEFASCLLMLALGLPGDIRAGDCGVADDESRERGEG